MKIFRLMTLYLLFASLILTVACGDHKVEENIYNHLEETVEIERELPTIHEKLAQLEKEENDIYDQIFEESLENKAALQSIADDALKILDEQREHIVEEAETIDQSQTEFIQIKPLIDELGKDDIIDQAEQVYEAMVERYELYEQWFESYEQSLNINEELYNLFFEDDLDVDQFNLLVESSNESSEQAQINLTELSEQTSTYNNLKTSFYEQLDLNIAQ